MNYPNPGNRGSFLNTATFPELYDLVNKNFTTLMAMVPAVAEQLFIVDDAPNPAPADMRIDEYDIETFASRKPEAQGTVAANMAIGYTVSMTPLRFGKKVVVTYEHRRHAMDRKVGGDLESLAHFVPQRKELDLTHILTFGTATSYTNMEGESITLSVGDGLSLFNVAHTLKHSSTTYSNRLSTDPLFSKGSLEAAELLMSTDILSNFGEKRVMSFNKIFCANTPSMINAVRRLIGSSSDDTQNNSGVKNTYSGKYDLVVLPYLATTATGANDSTKKNWWGIVATAGGSLGNRWQAYLRYWERSHLVSPEEGQTKNGDTDVWEFHTRGYYGVRAATGRGIIASCPTS